MLTRTKTLVLAVLILNALACPDPAKKTLSAFHKEMDNLTLNKNRCEEALATLGGECTASSFGEESRFVVILIHPSRLTLMDVGASIAIGEINYEPASPVQIALEDGSFPAGELRGQLVTELHDTLYEWGSVARQMEQMAEEEIFGGVIHVAADDSIPFQTIRQTIYSAGQSQWSGFISVFRANGQLRANGYGSPEIGPPSTRLKDPIGDHASEHPAHDACTAEQQAPVLVDKVPLEVKNTVGLLREGAVPLHDGLAQESAAELDARNRDNDGIAEHELEDLDCLHLRAIVSTGSIGRVEVVETRFAGGISDHQEVHNPKDREEYGGYQEHVLQLEILNDHVADIKGEVDPEADENPKDGTEYPAFPHVEPGRVALHNGHGAETLEVHVQAIESRQGCREICTKPLAILSELEGFPGDKAHEEVGYGGTCSTHEDGELASIPIRQWAIEEEGEAIDPCTHHEDGGEVPIGHEGVADSCGQILGEFRIEAVL